MPFGLAASHAATHTLPAQLTAPTALEELIRTENENAAYLLDAPEREHVIYDGGVRLGVSENGLMVPWMPPDEALEEVFDLMFGRIADKNRPIMHRSGKVAPKNRRITR